MAPTHGINLVPSLPNSLLSSFADDTTLLNGRLADELIDHVESQYCQASGAKLNADKTLGFWLNPTNIDVVPVKCRIIPLDESMRVLGVQLGSSNTDSTNRSLLVLSL